MLVTINGASSTNCKFKNMQLPPKAAYDFQYESNYVQCSFEVVTFSQHRCTDIPALMQSERFVLVTDLIME